MFGIIPQTCKRATVEKETPLKGQDLSRNRPSYTATICSDPMETKKKEQMNPKTHPIHVQLDKEIEQVSR